MGKKKFLSGILILAAPVAAICIITMGRVNKLQAQSHYEPHLLINEAVADNLSTLKNEKGVYSDWIEIYNPTDEAVELKNYYLSDSKNELSKWAFPDISISPGGYIIIFCDNDISEENEYLHANFFINAGKETIYLSDAGENIIDKMTLSNQQCDISYGRIYGNGGETGFLPYSTPGGPNPSKFSQKQKEEADWGDVEFSYDGGIYENDIEVELSCDIEGAVILYTLDGSEPDINDNIYDKPIKVTGERKPNKYTAKKCILKPGDGISNADTEYGVNEVYKGTVIRARILKDAKMSSSIQTNTYFINPDYSLPIVSISVDPYEMFDDKDGAYVLGYTYYTMRKFGNNPNRTNSNLPRKLAGHVEIYDTDGSVFSDDMFFSISGRSSLSRNIQKSFNVELNNSEITGGMVGGSSDVSYGKFSIRGPGSGTIQTNTYAYPSSYVSNVISGEGIGGQKSRFCILFIDGEYWGIYSLMEPKGKEYMEKYTGIRKKDIDLIMPYKRITNDEFDRLFEEIEARSFDNTQDYEWLKTKIDLDNYMAFVLAEAYFGNTDGIKDGDHNYYLWKEKGGLWKWQAFDFDCTMVDGNNYFKTILEFKFADVKGEEKKNFSMWLFQKLWGCGVFRGEFEEYVRLKCKGVYSKENIMFLFEEHVSGLVPEMEENLLRCEKGYTRLKKISYAIRGIEAEYSNYKMEDWNITVKDFKRFLENRTDAVIGFIDEITAM